MKTVFKNGVMLDGKKRDIGVEDGVIVGIGKVEEAGAVRVELGGKLVMPGLVNAHGHTAMTLVRGLGGGLPLQRWLEEAIFPVEAKMKPADVAAGALWGALEMLSGGTTAVGDMYDFPDAYDTVLTEAGIKASVNRVGLAFADNVPPGRLDECIAYVKRGCEERLNRDFSIHSEYLTNEKFCRELAAANREFRRPVHVHVSETAKEHEECIARHGKTPIRYLADTGLLDYGAYAAHCVYCTDDDFRVMAEKGVSLVHNPTSNMKLGSGFARIPRAIELGVNVALGTDGCASNDNLDMFEEMHLASLIHKGLAKDPTAMPARTVIAMATANGAKALGRADTGTIEVGKRADFVIVDLDRPHLIPALDYENLVVHSMHSSDVAMTVVDGEIVFERTPDGAPVWPRVDYERAKFEFLAAVRRLGL